MVRQDLEVRALIGGRMLSVPVVEGQVGPQHRHCPVLGSVMVCFRHCYQAPCVGQLIRNQTALAPYAPVRSLRLGKQSLLPVKVPVPIRGNNT